MRSKWNCSCQRNVSLALGGKLCDSLCEWSPYWMTGPSFSNWPWRQWRISGRGCKEKSKQYKKPRTQGNQRTHSESSAVFCLVTKSFFFNKERRINCMHTNIETGERSQTRFSPDASFKPQWFSLSTQPYAAFVEKTSKHKFTLMP